MNTPDFAGAFLQLLVSANKAAASCNHYHSAVLYLEASDIATTQEGKRVTFKAAYRQLRLLPDSDVALILGPRAD